MGTLESVPGLMIDDQRGQWLGGTGPVSIFVNIAGGEGIGGAILPLAIGINDTGGKFAASIIDTGGKLATGINNTSGTGGKLCHRCR